MRQTETNPNMLVLARQVRGLTQKDLATHLGISQGKISKIEQGLARVDEADIQKLSEKLEFPANFFLQPGQIYPAEINLFRKRQTPTKRDRDQINALLNIQYQNLVKLLQSVEVDAYLPEVDLEEIKTPQEVAKILRHFWRIPNGPINNLTALVEKAGVFVFHIDTPTRKFDGIRFIADSDIPIIAVNKNMPPDRMRFTLAHELGHLLMHSIMTPKADDEANAFASEFLIPSDEIDFPVTRVSLSHLADLKRYWKVSTGALIVKAKDMGVINPRQYQYLWTQMGQLGYRTREPVELDPPYESPSLIKEILRLHIEELSYSEKDLIELFSISNTDFEDWWKPYLPYEKPKPRLTLKRGGMYYKN